MRSIRSFVVIGVLVGLFGGVAFGVNGASAQDTANAYRWDIFQFVDDEPFIEPFASGEGGVAYAYAQDGTIIMLTGSGTFQLDDPTAVTGGGLWTTFPSHGLAPTGEGTYTVTELISFVEAPGTIPPVIGDTIAERTDARAGLAVMRIVYADADGNPAGSGVLTVSSRLAKDSPASIFVGVTVTKDFTAFWDRFEPVRGVNANRANFHVIPETTD
ncbi:MAG: hypothetical protein K8S97_11600 [Anaerolineae bacterium]|nr:hypothetical protein [Anaerolineae bacterium]